MERVFLECLIRSTLIAVAVQLVLWSMRVRSAAARHNAWACVMIAMLCLLLWTAWGPRAAIPLPATTLSQELPSPPKINLGPAASPPLAELAQQPSALQAPRLW